MPGAGGGSAIGGEGVVENNTRKHREPDPVVVQKRAETGGRVPVPDQELLPGKQAGGYRHAAGLTAVINVGSVGQPRDGNAKAKYVIFDTDEFTVELRLVAYDIDKTAELIRRRGFPDDNADRLYGNWMEVLGGGDS